MAFQVGDKIKCISPGENTLTEGKVYKVIKAEFENAVHVVDDLGNMVYIFVDRFVSFDDKKPLSNFKSGDKVYINQYRYEKDKIYTLDEDYADIYPKSDSIRGEWFMIKELNLGAKFVWMTLANKTPEIKEKIESTWGF